MQKNKDFVHGRLLGVTYRAIYPPTNPDRKHICTVDGILFVVLLLLVKNLLHQVVEMFHFWFRRFETHNTQIVSYIIVIYTFIYSGSN